jgi:hypothetical protein
MTVIGALSPFRELGHAWIVRRLTPARGSACLIGRDPSTLLARRRDLSVGRHDRCPERHHTRISTLSPPLGNPFSFQTRLLLHRRIWYELLLQDSAERFGDADPFSHKQIHGSANGRYPKPND